MGLSVSNLVTTSFAKSIGMDGYQMAEKNGWNNVRVLITDAHARIRNYEYHQRGLRLNCQATLTQEQFCELTVAIKKIHQQMHRE